MSGGQAKRRSQLNEVANEKVCLQHKLVERTQVAGSCTMSAEEWLNNTVQRAVLLGSSSKWITGKSGVPQGSVLGPFCFLNIYK